MQTRWDVPAGIALGVEDFSLVLPMAELDLELAALAQELSIAQWRHRR